jgi:phosphoglycolate phosphatase
VLKTLSEGGIQVAVASNKYQSATQKLVAQYFPGIPFVEVLGQREGIAPKPDPTIVFDILRTAGIAKEEVLYVGDSNVDMMTAKNAGVSVCGVTWGFRPRTELEAHHPDFLVDKAEEILEIVKAK